VQSVDLAATPGRITVKFGRNAHEKIHGKTLVFVPAANDATLLWTCQPGTLTAKKYLPSECRPTS
jgi:hypothetical protein